MFPTTVWTTIRHAGEDDAAALEEFAGNYRPAVLQFIRRKGFADAEAQDICQDVFVRLLKGKVLARADMRKGKFRSLLLAVTVHVIQDRFRRRTETPVAEIEPAASIAEAEDGDFDEAWALHLSQQAMARLREESPGYHQVLEEHLSGRRPHRNKLWIARNKLIAHIRAEIARTVSSHAEFEEEVAYLTRYLRPQKNE